MRNFRVYLAGVQFTIRMEYNTLHWLLDAKEPKGQMDQWIQELG